MLKAPFPWFGGKSRVAAEVWKAFGGVKNYVEPFFGSGAVLLGRPGGSFGTETINDIDGYVANFWRSIASDPGEVAHYADWPVSECDLTARHIWLVEQRGNLVDKLCGDPDWCDPKIAGWWVWGICAWIGGNWCSGAGPWHRGDDGRVTKEGDGNGVSRQLPQLLCNRGVSRRLPHLGKAGQGVHSDRGLEEWFSDLATRMRRVRVCCGDWSRVCGSSPTYHVGLTGVFLDPPYSAEAERDNMLYACEDLTVAHDVRAWCMTNGESPLMRIALCGYDGEHNALKAVGWRVHAWKACGGMSNIGNGRGKENARRERIWFSPHCINNVLL